MEFVTGFIGVHQDKDSLALRPEIGWAVIDKQMTPSQSDIKDYTSEGDEVYRKFLEKKKLQQFKAYDLSKR